MTQIVNLLIVYLLCCLRKEESLHFMFTYTSTLVVAATK